MNKNPYRRAERIAAKVRDVFAILLACFAGLLLVAALVAAAVHEGWGWWSLLVIPAIPVGLAVIGVLVAGWWALIGLIQDKWRDAKYRWEDEHRQTLATSVLLSGGTSSDAGGES